MAFEIPQALEYEEKIIWELTFRQFASIGLPGVAIGWIFQSGLALVLKAVLIAVLAFLAIGFAFLKFDKLSYNIFSYYRHPRNLGYTDPRMVDIVSVKDVSHDTILLRNGQKRAILQLKPINFMIKSETDRSGIIAAFQKFLNSLDFPIQILVRTVNMNLGKYLEGLKENVTKNIPKERKANMQKLFDDYYDFLSNYVQQNAVKNRLFYLVIPAPTSNNSAKEEKEREELEQLKIRVQLCKEGLATMGIYSERITTNKLISLLASFYDGYIEVENDYLFPITIFKKFAEEVREDAEENSKQLVTETAG